MRTSRHFLLTKTATYICSAWAIAYICVTPLRWAKRAHQVTAAGLEQNITQSNIDLHQLKLSPPPVDAPNNVLTARIVSRLALQYDQVARNPLPRLPAGLTYPPSVADLRTASRYNGRTAAVWDLKVAREGSNSCGITSKEDL